MISKDVLMYTKSDIASILGVLYQTLNKNIPPEIENTLQWSKRGRSKFFDDEVFLVVKHFRRLLPDEEIIKLIRPRCQIGFTPVKIKNNQ